MTRRGLVAIALGLFAGSAEAQPGVCNVTIVRAPDGVREVVEGWVRAEPRCTGTLEVRIVATDGGYYLFARDLAGRIRERVVPDPQSAGVLIASWAADDSAPIPPPPTPAILVPATPTQAPFVDSAPRARRSYYWGGWLTLAYVSGGATSGLRAEADIAGRGPITAGVSLSMLGFRVPWGNTTDTTTGEVISGVDGNDFRAVVYGTDTFRQGALSMRVGLGAGAMRTASVFYDGTMSYAAAGWVPIGELALELGFDLGSRWSLTAGAIGTLFGESWITGWTGSSSQQVGTVSRYGDIVGMFGVRCRL